MKLQNHNEQTILKVLKYGDPLLRKKVDNIINFEGLSTLIEQMFSTMYAENGIGLAANQIGKSINLFILDTRNMEEEGKKFIFINSEIIAEEGEAIMEEGCLSVPDIRASITRPESITIRYRDLDNNINEMRFNGLISRVIQHEMDHLQGRYFVDYLSPSKRKFIHKRLLEIAKHGKPSTGIIV